MAAQLQFKDQKLAYQPFHDVLRNFETAARSKNIQKPFDEQGFESVLQMETVRDTLVNGLGAQFKGNESLQSAFKSCVKHAFEEHSNPFSGYTDVRGNDMVFGAEGYGATAVNGNYNAWTRLAPVLTAGYLARSRALEFYQIINDDKPTFVREYSVKYTQKGLAGERILLPKAIRSGKVSGMLDLPLCEPVAANDPTHKNIKEQTFGSPSKKLNFILVGSTGNLMEQSQFPDGTPINRFKHVLERKCEIDYVWAHIEDADTDKDIYVRTMIEGTYKFGKTSERVFNHVLQVPYVKGGKTLHKTVRVSALFDLDTGNYHVLNDGSNLVKGIHFKIRVTNVANEMETYMNGADHHIVSFDIENKIYGSIPVIPEMMADFNAAGEGVSWVAFMTNEMTETYAGIRDNDLEDFLDEMYTIKANMFELAFKLGGFKYSGSYPIIPRHPGGSDDILAPQRMAFKQYLTRIFTRSEKYTYFDRNIERQWILMANDEDVDILPDVSWTSTPAEFTTEGAGNNFRYGFSLDDAYGYMDNFGRKTRVIGSRDERWLGRSIWAVNKSLSLAAPTTLYFPFMFRAFSSISPDLRNRPAILFASRDAKRVCTMLQARITLEGNDLNLMANAAAFAAGHSAPFNKVYTNEGVKEVGNESDNPLENMPNYITIP